MRIWRRKINECCKLQPKEKCDKIWLLEVGNHLLESGRVKMLKKGYLWISFVLITGIFLVFAGVTKSNVIQVESDDVKRKVESITDSGSYSSDDVKKLEERILNHKAKLKTEVWYGEELLSDIRLNVNGTYAGGNIGYYWRFVKNQIGHYPTENVRKMTDTKGTYYYLVYQLNHGGRLFLFSRDGFGYGFPVYMEKTLAKKDFASLAVGDDMEKVEKIDPASKKMREAFETSLGKKEPMAFIRDCETLDVYYPFTSVHLLTDGLLLIEYDVVGEATERHYVVRDILWNEEFLMPDFAPIYMADYYAETGIKVEAKRYPMKILEQDYIGGGTPVS